MGVHCGSENGRATWGTRESGRTDSHLNAPLPEVPTHDQPSVLLFLLLNYWRKKTRMCSFSPSPPLTRGLFPNSGPVVFHLDFCHSPLWPFCPPQACSPRSCWSSLSELQTQSSHLSCHTFPWRPTDQTSQSGLVNLAPGNLHSCLSLLAPVTGTSQAIFSQAMQSFL